MDPSSREKNRPSVGPRWLTAQAVGMGVMVVTFLLIAFFWWSVGSLGGTVFTVLFALLALVFYVVFARARRGSAWSASVWGRDIYERDAWTKPVLGAYRDVAGLQRIMFAFVLTLVLTTWVRGVLVLLPIPWPPPSWLETLVRVTAFVAIYSALLANGRRNSRRSVAAALSKRTGAVFLPEGSALEATHALARISTAIGLAGPPALRVIPTAAVNAWVTGPRERVAVAVTAGMLQGFPASALEAVFADLLVRAADPLVSDYSRVAGISAMQLDFLASVPRGRLGTPVVPWLSAADDMALLLLRNADPLIDALQRTRSAASREIPGMNAMLFPMLWACPLSGADTSDHLDVEAERIKALGGVAAFEVDKALAEPMRQWFFLVGDQQHGPVSEREIYSMVREDRLEPSALVWTDGMSDWLTASTAPEFPNPALG